MSSCGSNAYQLVNNQWLDMDSDEYDEYMAGRDVEHKRLARAGREQQQFYAGRVDIVRDMVEVVYASARNPISFSVRAQGNRVVCVGVGKAQTATIDEIARGTGAVQVTTHNVGAYAVVELEF